ncbi:sentrin-specific protease 5 [Hemiscyllium ocellatum]|uniref:sentrin-specific protease 5 n=1 Tax=Hemiscyllium ocellatum TaxID=170820 RepID=UPI002965E123|nr:sentrin-specific protease 5 [Hemiscyllium ocellatum]
MNGAPRGRGVDTCARAGGRGAAGRWGTWRRPRGTAGGGGSSASSCIQQNCQTMKELSNGKCSKRFLRATFREQLRSHHSKWKHFDGSLCSQRQFYYQQKQRLWLSIRKKRAKSALRKALLDCQQCRSVKDTKCLKATWKKTTLLTSRVNDTPTEGACTPTLVPQAERECKGREVSEVRNSSAVASDTDCKSTILYCKAISRKLTATSNVTCLKSLRKKKSGLHDKIINQKLLNGFKRIDFQGSKDSVFNSLPRKTKRQLKGHKICLLYRKPSLFSFRYRILNNQNRWKKSTCQKQERLNLVQTSNPKKTGQCMNKMACDTSSLSPPIDKDSSQNLEFASDQNNSISETMKQDKNSCLISCCEVSVTPRDERMDISQMQETASHFVQSSEKLIESNNQAVDENSETMFPPSSPLESDASCASQLVGADKWPKIDGAPQTFIVSQGRLKNKTPVCDGEMQVINVVMDSSPVSYRCTNTSLNETGQSVCLQSGEPCPVLQPQLLDHIYYRSTKEHESVRTEPLPRSEAEKGKENESQTSSIASEQLISCIHAFLDEFLTKYGSLIPLTENDVLMNLEQIFHQDFHDRKTFIRMEIRKYQKAQVNKPEPSFQVVYNKHVLTLDDLATLYGENWLNDQVINMYGELIVDAVPDKVHFFNSFFYKQLQTKGYNGVKRWTKKVDLFSKALLLIPIHLEIHWSLLTVDLPNRKICLYDSQGIHFNSCVQNILKYLKTEAGERNRPAFLEGWKAFATTCIPQQKNDSDCGVFVLQYCKCLALGRPFQFSQKDMPEVRKLIYRELCECKLME